MSNSAYLEMTQSEYDSLQAQLEVLEGPGRKEMAEAIAFARDFGDITENAEYIAARDEQALLEARIQRLRARLDMAVIVKGQGRAIDIGSIVELDDQNGERLKIIISSVPAEENDLVAVSPLSPLGRSLKGASSGEKVEVRAPGGNWIANVISVHKNSLHK